MPATRLTRRQEQPLKATLARLPVDARPGEDRPVARGIESVGRRPEDAGHDQRRDVPRWRNQRSEYADGAAGDAAVGDAPGGAGDGAVDGAGSVVLLQAASIAIASAAAIAAMPKPRVPGGVAPFLFLSTLSLPSRNALMSLSSRRDRKRLDTGQPQAPVCPHDVQKSQPSLRIIVLFPHSGHLRPASSFSSVPALRSFSGTERIPTWATG